MGNSFRRLLCFWHSFISWTSVKFLEYLVSGSANSPGLSYIFPVSVLEAAVSSRIPVSFYLRMVLETKSWAVGMLLATEIFLVIRPPQLTEQQNICVYINPCMYTSTSILYVAICIYIKLNMCFTRMSPILMHYQMDHSNLFLLFICNFPPQQWETSPPTICHLLIQWFIVQ